MTQSEERHAIFKALKEYREKYNADYYCVILTPPKGQELTLTGNFRHSHAHGAGLGKNIEDMVWEKMLLLPPRKRK